MNRWLFRPITITILIFFGLLSLINTVFNKPLPESQLIQGKIWHEIHQYDQAEIVLRQWLNEHPDDLEAHYYYLEAVYSIPDRQRPSAALEARYSTLMMLKDSASIGMWGKAWSQLYQNNPAAALHSFEKINQENLKYTYLGLGEAYLKLHQFDFAEQAFLKEIALNGNNSLAVQALFSTYLIQGKIQAAADFIKSDPENKTFVDRDDLRKLAFALGDWEMYFDLLLFLPVKTLHLFAIGSSLFILAMWFIYFWRIDVFEQEPLWISLLVVIGGAVMTLLAVVFEDFSQIIHPMILNGQLLNDLTYSIGWIGLPEEFLKFLPVIFVIVFSKQINEPVDLVIYASLSALGFATVENIVVISQVGERILIARLLIATLMHMASTAILAYIWAMFRFVRKRGGVFAVIFGWCLAGTLHGLFDYLVLSPRSPLALTPFLILVFTIWIYGVMLRNSLNFSPFFSKAVLVSSRLINYEWILSTGLWVLLLGYIYFYLQFYTAVANAWVLENLWTTLPVVLGIFASLGELSLKKGKFVFP